MENKELIKNVSIDFARRDKLVKNLKDVLKIYDKDNLNDFYYFHMFPHCKFKLQTLIR